MPERKEEKTKTRKTRKNFVLDTNVLVHDPKCIEKFEENNIYVCSTVIEELDGLKSRQGETGYAAREALRLLKAARAKGNLITGVATEGGGKLYVSDEDITAAQKPFYDSNDGRIVAFASYLKKERKKKNVILVSNDAGVLIRADMAGVEAQEYYSDRVGDHIYGGRAVCVVDTEMFMRCVAEERIRLDEFEQAIINGPDELMENEFLNVTAEDGSSVLRHVSAGYVVPLVFENVNPSHIRPRNSGQSFAIEALMSDANVHPLTLLAGKAGTGKTLLALACGLKLVKDGRYRQVLLCRPNVMMDEEIGFLPGTEKEKISPLMRGAVDNLEVMLRKRGDTPEDVKKKVADLFESGLIDFQSIGYLRGRSIAGTYVIIDEAQNATQNQILSIITRAGEGSKFVIMGDPAQIDNTHLDSHSNGLVYAIERMKDSPLCEVLEFSNNECTRSPLALDASERLKKI